MTDKPFGVNLTILPSINRRLTRNIAQRSSRAASRSSKPLATSADHVTEFKKHGVVVIHKCTSVRHALSAERMASMRSPSMASNAPPSGKTTRRA